MASFSVDRNSALLFVRLSRSRISSVGSVEFCEFWPTSAVMRRKRTTRWYVFSSRSSSSRRVPLRAMSMAGKTRFSESLRSSQLPVAGALELLEDHLVHAAPSVHQAGGDDGQAAPVFDV